MYKVSINKPNNKCIIHLVSCSSPEQVIGKRKSDNQKYSESFKTYEEAVLYCKKENFSNYHDCKKCLPNKEVN